MLTLAFSLPQNHQSANACSEIVSKLYRVYQLQDGSDPCEILPLSPVEKALLSSVGDGMTPTLFHTSIPIPIPIPTTLFSQPRSHPRFLPIPIPIPIHPLPLPKPHAHPKNPAHNNPNAAKMKSLPYHTIPNHTHPINHTIPSHPTNHYPSHPFPLSIPSLPIIHRPSKSQKPTHKALKKSKSKSKSK